MTLNQVIQRLRTLTISHKQIKGFEFGDIVDFLANKDLVYPACFASMDTANISKADRQTTFNFRIWLTDLVNVSKDSKSNEVEVLSDLTSIAEDILALMNNPAYTNAGDDSWEISLTSPLTYATEQFEDLVGAVFMDVSISIRYNSNRCVVPTVTISDMNKIYYGYALTVPTSEADILSLPQSSFLNALTLSTGPNKIFAVAIPESKILQLAYNQTSQEDVTSEFDLTLLSIDGYSYKIYTMQNTLPYSVNQEIIITLI